MFSEELFAFAKMVTNANVGKDEGLNVLKKEITLREEIELKRYGQSYIGYSPIIISDNEIKSDIKNSSIYHQESDNKTYLVVKIPLNRDSFSYLEEYQTILDSDFDLCVVYELASLTCDGMINFRFYLERTVNVYVITKYGNFEVFNTTRDDNTVVKNIIKEAFKDRIIKVYPSNKSQFSTILKYNIEGIILRNSSSISEKDFEFSLEIRKIDQEHIYSGTYSYSGEEDVFIDNVLFASYKDSSMLSLYNVIIKNNYEEDVTFYIYADPRGFGFELTSQELARDTCLCFGETTFDANLFDNMKIVKITRGINQIVSEMYIDFINATEKYDIIKKATQDMIDGVYTVDYVDVIHDKSGKYLPFGRILFGNNNYYTMEKNGCTMYLCYQEKIVIDEQLYRKNTFILQIDSTKEMIVLSILESLRQICTLQTEIKLPLAFYSIDNYIIGNIYEIDAEKEKITDRMNYSYIKSVILSEFGHLPIKQTLKSKKISFSDDFIKETVSNLKLSFKAKKEEFLAYHDIGYIDTYLNNELITSGCCHAIQREIGFRVDDKRLILLRYLNEESSTVSLNEWMKYAHLNSTTNVDRSIVNFIKECDF